MTRKTIQVALSGYYGYGNGGDEALLATLIQMLPPQALPLVLSANPELTTQQHGVAACDRNSPTAVWRALRSSEGFIWGGGSLIQDATSALSPLYYTGLMTIAQRLGLKTIAWGQGIGPLKQPTTQWLAKTSFQGCTAVSIRDHASAQLLEQWGIAGTLAPDPVWALESAPLPDLADLPSPRVAVVLRSHSQLTPERLNILTQALQQFQQITQTFIVLLPFQASQDLAIAQTLHAQLPASQILQVADPRQLKGVFRGVELAIAMRLHGLIMAAAEGCRCFALSYDPKVSQLMQELSLPGWLLSELPSNPQTICQTWLTSYASAPVAPAQVQSLVERALRHRQVLAQGLQI